MKTINDLKGQYVTHKLLGPCKIIEIICSEDAKFIGELVHTGETKKFILSKKFFDFDGDVVSSTKEFKEKHKPQKFHNRIDYNKHRNHPLVKEIDSKESRNVIS